MTSSSLQKAKKRSRPIPHSHKTHVGHKKFQASMSKRLTQFLTTPSRVAGALDWKRKGGSIVSLDICRDRIDLSVASHPCNGDSPTTLEPIPLLYDYSNKTKSLRESVVQQLQDVVEAHKVCGFVVAWPLQREGRLGAPCGRVLHTLDSILLANSPALLTPGRKFCLWDGAHVPREHEDKWGRCEIYGRSSADDSLHEHIASREQYNQWTQGPPDEVWRDFAKAHWPEFCPATERAASVADEGSIDYNHGDWLDSYEERGAYLQAEL